MDQFADLLRALSGAVDLHVLGLLVARILPFVAFTPLFGGQETPRRFRFAVSVVLALALLPLFTRSWSIESWDGRYVPAIAREALIGFSIAGVVALTFELFASIGALIDLARGATFANVLDPSTQERGSVLASFMRVMLLALFAVLGLHRRFITALVDGFTALPPTTAALDDASGPRLLALLSDLFATAVKLALPVIICLLLLDLALGLINRAASQVQVFFLGLALKGTVGLVVIVLVVAVSAFVWLAATLPHIDAWASGK